MRHGFDMVGATFRIMWLGIAATVLILGTPAMAAPADGARPVSSFDQMVADTKSTMLADPSAAINKARRAETIARQLPAEQRTIAVATAQWLQGEAYLRIDDVVHAEPLIEAAFASVSGTKRPTKLNGDLLLSRGTIHVATAKVAAALEDYQRAHNIFRDLGESRSRAIALIDIAVLYQEAKDQQNALKYFSQALDVNAGDKPLLLSIYNNRGNGWKELNRFAEADRDFRKALFIARQMQSAGLEARILSNIARNELKSGQLDLADKTIAQGFGVSRGEGAGEAGKQFWGLAAQLALQRGEIPKAAQLIARSFAGADLRKTALGYREAHQTAYEIFKRLGDENAALPHLEALKRLDDQATQLAASTNTALAAARFDFANQETKIAKLKADELQRTVDFERAAARTQQYVFVGSGVVAVIIVSMLAFGIVTLRRSRNEVRAANIDLAATNSALGKALAAKTEFLATTSHEIRTPLNGILGMTQVMLADRTLSAPLRDRIGVVHGAGISMRALVDDILDIAKMETGNLTIERVPFDVKATLTDVTRMWEEQAKGRGIDFTLNLADCPARIEGDAARLRQITFNLLSNALKFTESGSVGVRAFVSGDSDDRLSIAISDTGIGIPADKKEMIFESFRQGDAGTTRKYGGTGLGLAICRNLARAMDGDVRVDSIPGSGSVFTLDIPLFPAATTTPDVTESGETNAHALLIVDRSPITRAMLRTVLEKHSGTVRFAASVEEAEAALQAGGIDKVLIDEATIKAGGDPHGDAARIAAALTSLVQTAVLWASPDAETTGALRAAGIDLVIAKPIGGVALAELLYPQDGPVDVTEPLVTQAA